MRYASLAAFLLAFWMALSGHYTTLLIVISVLSVTLGVYIAHRMNIVDEEALPLRLLPRALTYWPWLAWEIVKSAWAVSMIIINPKLPISPTMTVVKPSQRSTVGVATYANSITLTPGTITTAATEEQLTVHALTRDGALDLESGAMDARVAKFDGGA